MSQKNRNKGIKDKDTILKEFFRDNRRFADFFNGVLFGGKTVIRSEELQEMDTDVSSMIKEEEYLTTVSRARDVVKKSSYGVEFVVLGLENQMLVHYAMPLRAMIYDDLTYLRECNQVIARNKQEKSLESNAEFLSGFKKTDKLHGVVTIVIYYGNEPWDGPVALSDMLDMSGIPEEIKGCVTDYRMNLFQVIDSGEINFQNQELNIVFKVSALLLRREFEQLEDTVKLGKIDRELKEVIGAITGSTKKLEDYWKEKGRGENMAAEDMRTWVDDLMDMGEEKGLVKGRQEGRKEGRQLERENSIRILIETCMDLNVTKEIVSTKVEQKYALSKDTVQEYMKKYWIEAR